MNKTSSNQVNLSRNKKVWVGVSGGVDSSVALYLLQQAGYDVTAVFIRSWQPKGYPCTLTTDRQDALRVAAHLEVPFRTIDLSEVYKRAVVDAFIEEYRQRNTPNPDVLCNREVKFGAFLNEARKHGAMVATGHYARTDGTKLLMANDANKDQTYFLYRLTTSDLKDVLFPLAQLTKPEVRALALQAGLPTATKEESQGLCFVGEIPMKEFLKPYLPHVPGNIVREDGSVVGTHEGVLVYTIGEKVPASGGKAYVTRIDHAQNLLVVSDMPPILKTGQLIPLLDVSWVDGVPLPGTYHARFRHRGELIPVSLAVTEEVAVTPLKSIDMPPAPGQSAVIYANGVCLGGGIVGHARVSPHQKS